MLDEYTIGFVDCKSTRSMCGYDATFQLTEDVLGASGIHCKPGVLMTISSVKWSTFLHPLVLSSALRYCNSLPILFRGSLHIRLR